MSSFIPRSKIRGSSLVLFVNLTTGYYSKMNSLELESSNWLQQNMLLVQQIFGHWALGESSGSTMVVFLKPLILVGVDVLLLLWLYGLESYITPLNIIITFFCAILYFFTQIPRLASVLPVPIVGFDLGPSQDDFLLVVLVEVDERVIRLGSSCRSGDQVRLLSK